MASVAQTVYFLNAQTVPAPKKMRWDGRVISGLVLAFLLFDAGSKLMRLAPVVEGTVRLCLLPDLCRGGDLGGTVLVRRPPADTQSLFCESSLGSRWNTVSREQISLSLSN